MKAALIDSLERGPRYADFDEPVVTGGDTLVEVTAAGLHPIVRALASGEHQPSRPCARFKHLLALAAQLRQFGQGQRRAPPPGPPGTPGSDGHTAADQPNAAGYQRAGSAR